MNLRAECLKYFGSADVYEIFDLSPDATMGDIRKAFRRLCRQTHPDRVDRPKKQLATEKFQLIVRLYEVLCDEKLVPKKVTKNDRIDYKWLEQWCQKFRNIYIRQYGYDPIEMSGKSDGKVQLTNEDANEISKSVSFVFKQFVKSPEMNTIKVTDKASKYNVKSTKPIISQRSRTTSLFKPQSAKKPFMHKSCKPKPIGIGQPKKKTVTFAEPNVKSTIYPKCNTKSITVNGSIKKPIVTRTQPKRLAQLKNQRSKMTVGSAKKQVVIKKINTCLQKKIVNNRETENIFKKLYA